MFRLIGFTDSLAESTIHDLAAPVLAAVYTMSTIYGYILSALFAALLSWRMYRHACLWLRARRSAGMTELDDIARAYRAGEQHEAQAERIAAEHGEGV